VLHRVVESGTLSVLLFLTSNHNFKVIACMV
jgi:hypothetical protein